MLSLVGCSQPDGDHTVIEGIIAVSKAESGDNTLGSMTNFEWEEVYFFPENTAVDKIQANTGVELRGGLLSGDHLYNSTLAFINDGILVKTIQTLGAPLDFDSAHIFTSYSYPGELEVRGPAVYLTRSE
ncbi:hypothetical protein GCM10009860_25750 [Microbacterium mitrae]